MKINLCFNQLLQCYRHSWTLEVSRHVAFDASDWGRCPSYHRRFWMGLTGPPRRESLAEQVSKLRRSCAVKEAEVAKAKDDERPFGMKG